MANTNQKKKNNKIKRPKKRSGFSKFLRFLLLVIIVFFAGFFTFYAIDNNIFSRDAEEQEAAVIMQADISEDLQESDQADEEEKGAFFADLISDIKERLSGESEHDDYPNNIRMNFYFATLGEEMSLGFEERTIVAGNPNTAAMSAMNELLKGPSSAFYFPIIPPGSRVIGVEKYENFIRLNLSQEFLTNSLDSRILDELIIYSMVNTLTQIPEIDGVLFLIEGKSIKEYGNVDLSVPLIFNDSIIISQ